MGKVSGNPSAFTFAKFSSILLKSWSMSSKGTLVTGGKLWDSSPSLVKELEGICFCIFPPFWVSGITNSSGCPHPWLSSLANLTLWKKHDMWIIKEEQVDFSPWLHCSGCITCALIWECGTRITGYVSHNEERRKQREEAVKIPGKAGCISYLFWHSNERVICFRKLTAPLRRGGESVSMSKEKEMNWKFSLFRQSFSGFKNSIYLNKFLALWTKAYRGLFLSFFLLISVQLLLSFSYKHFSNVENHCVLERT